MDARRCVSYLTIESRSAIPLEFHVAVGEHLYGCDVCQDVCPWNVRFADAPPADGPLAPRREFSLTDASRLAHEILALDEPAYRERFRGSAIKRATLSGLRRNAAVVLANIGER